jgi:hypothetical protein
MLTRLQATLFPNRTSDGDSLSLSLFELNLSILSVVRRVLIAALSSFVPMPKILGQSCFRDNGFADPQRHCFQDIYAGRASPHCSRAWRAWNRRTVYKGLPRLNNRIVSTLFLYLVI